MDVLDNYLENIFKGLPNSEETKKTKQELSSMMEDKYNELLAQGKNENEAIGIVISEVGSVEELFSEPSKESSISADNSRKILLSIEKAKQYIDYSKTASVNIGTGISLLVCSPIMLILLGGMAEEGILPINHEKSGFIGLIILFALVAAGVAILMFSLMKGKEFEYLKDEDLLLESNAQAFVRNEKNKSLKKDAIRITFGVVICILAVVPVFSVNLLVSEESKSMASVVSVGILIGLVAIAVFLFVVTGIRSNAFSLLLQEKEYTQRSNKVISKVASVYWPFITLIYLGWSFLTFNWAYTWIIWPLAGVFFAVVSAIINIFGKTEKTG